MTPEKYRRIKSLVKALSKQADRAAEFDIMLVNGADVSSLLGSMVADLEATLNEREDADHG